MAYNSLQTTTDIITLTKPMISIPLNIIVDTITLKFSVTLKNTTASAVDVSAAELLNSVRRIALYANGNINIIDTNGYGIAIANAFRWTKSNSPLKQIGTTTVGANTTVTKTFFLRLNEGDVIAAIKKSLTLEVNFTENVKETGTAGTYITITAATVTPTFGEGIVEDKQADLLDRYGANGEFAAEPKIYEMSVDVPANTSFTPVLPLQYGCLIRRAFMMFYSTAAGTTSPEVLPDEIGLIATNPIRQDLIHVDAETLRAIQDEDYWQDDLTNRPAGVFMFDFANTLAGDGMGLKGWRFNLEDFKLAVKTSTACKMKVIFIEHVVNTAAYDAGKMPILETPLGF